MLQYNLLCQLLSFSLKKQVNVSSHLHGTQVLCYVCILTFDPDHKVAAPDHKVAATAVWTSHVPIL